MYYSDQFRDPGRVEKLVKQISLEATGKYVFMEVCGGHTAAIFSHGILGLLPDNIRLLSGPGCPVCVTSKSYIDHALALSAVDGIVVATFGDLLRVPGNNSTLEREKAAGASVKVVYSVNQAVNMALKDSKRNIVFLAIGFETTAPGNACGIIEACKMGLTNFFVLSAHKVMPPAMKAIVERGTKVNGFICPGHVCAITGSSIYGFIPSDYGIGCVISGFEPVDILQSLLMLVKQVNFEKPKVEVQYTRAVKPEGNLKAISVMERVFRLSDDWWRGFGIIPGSGLQLKSQFGAFDAGRLLQLSSLQENEEGACKCGEILRGISSPEDCPLFSTRCTPDDPSGACMVSAEGSCNIRYKWLQKKMKISR